MTKLFQRALVAALIASLASVSSLRAQDTNTAPAKVKEKPAAKAKETKPAKEKTTTFSGKLGAIDKVMKSITLDDKKKTVVEVSSETLITKDGKPALMADGAIGEAVNGTAKKAEDGKLSALLLNYGKKVEAPKKVVSKPKKEKESKPTDAKAAPAAEPAATAPPVPPMTAPTMSAPVLTAPPTNTP